MRTTLLMGALACAPLGAAQAEIDCNEKSPLNEPPGWAEQCAADLATSSSFQLAPRATTDTGFKFNMSNDFGARGLYSYLVGDFSDETFIADTFPASSLFAHGWDFDSTGTTLWAHNNSTNELGTVDTSTGAFTQVSTVVLPGSQTFTGLTIDPVNDIFYVSGSGEGISTLYTLDPQTGVTTTVGNMTDLQIVIDIAMNCQGELFAHEIVTNALYRIDPTTAAPTFIGSHGLNANFAQGMDFDNEDGTLYGCIYTGGGNNTYAAWNTTTGAITPLNVNDPVGEWECAIPTTCSAQQPPDIEPPPSVLEIPTLGRIGLVLATLALAAGALMALRSFRLA